MRKGIIVISSALILTALFINQIALSAEKKKDVIKGERVEGYVGGEPSKEAVEKEDIEKWEKWQKRELIKRPEEIIELEDRYKALLEKWKERIFPNRYVITAVKGEVLINLKKADINDKISIRKDQIILRGISKIELIDEKTGSIKLVIRQNVYQRVKFYIGDMNVPIKSIDVYYNPSAKTTTVDAELQQLTFDVVVYEGMVYTVIDMPVSRPPVVTTLPAAPPLPPPEPYEG